MTQALAHTLAARGTKLDLGGRPLLMGILNATPDSFSDGGLHPDLASRIARGRDLIASGADLLDLGGESGVTNRPAVEPQEEIERVAPLVALLAHEAPATGRLAGEPTVLLSVDTYKPAVASAAIQAGASIVNDPSGLIAPELAEICAETGAALVLTHPRAPPKQKHHPPRNGDVVEDVKRFLAGRIEQACALGVSEEQLILCPGPDLGKDPAQTIELLHRLGELSTLGRPIMLSASRKDFVGALTGRRPRERLAGTLAAIGFGVARGARVLRVHDVAEVHDFLTVRAALEGELEVRDDLSLPDELRWQETERIAANEGSA
jgi:dihydropteroate synthase